MKFVVIFAVDFEAARKYAAEKKLQRGWWTFAASPQRIRTLDPMYCESAFLPDWSRNAEVVRAHDAWTAAAARRAKTA